MSRKKRNMDPHSQAIDSLYAEITKKENELHELRAELNKKKEAFRQWCVDHGGHDFEKEDNGDCHRRGYYYRCKRCTHFSLSLAGY